MSFSQIYSILYARKKTLALVVILTLIATLGISLVLPKVYTSSAELFIDYRGADPITGRQFSPMNDESYMQTQVDMIRSEDVADHIISATKLLSGDDARKLIAVHGEIKARSILLEKIAKNLEVTMRRTSRVIELKYSADRPEYARDGLNSALRAYMNLVMRISQTPAKSRQEQYSNQLDSLRAELDRIQQSITEYQQTHGIVDADEKLSSDTRQYGELATRLAAAQSQRLEATAKRRSLQSMLDAGVPVMDLPEIAQQRGLPELRLRLSDLSRQLAEVTNVYGQNHPRYKIVIVERDMLVRRIEREAEVAFRAVSAEQQRFEQQASAISMEVDNQQRRLLELKKHRDVIASYQREMESVRQIYTSAVQKYDELLMASTVNSPALAVLRWAELPHTHAKPILRSNLLMALPVGVLLSLALVFLTEFTNRRIRHPDDLEQELKLSILGRSSKLASRTEASSWSIRSILGVNARRTTKLRDPFVLNQSAELILKNKAYIKDKHIPEGRMGEVLIQIGRLTREQVDAIVALQKQRNILFGQAAQELGLLSAQEIDEVLDKQFNFSTPSGSIVSSLAIVHTPLGEDAEAIRRLRSQVLHKLSERDSFALALLGTSNSDGKSHTAASLAISFAQLNIPTMLVDANMRTPSQHKMFDLSNKVGLSTMLAKRSPTILDDIPVVMSNLWVLCAGPQPPNPIEILSPPNFSQLIESFAKYISVFIIDTPSATTSADAQNIALQAGNVLLICRENMTLMADMRILENELSDLGVNVMGAVYNPAAVESKPKWFSRTNRSNQTM